MIYNLDAVANEVALLLSIVWNSISNYMWCGLWCVDVKFHSMNCNTSSPSSLSSWNNSITYINWMSSNIMNWTRTAHKHTEHVHLQGKESKTNSSIDVHIVYSIIIHSMKWELCESKRANMYFAISRAVSHCVEYSSVPRNYLRTHTLELRIRMWIEWIRNQCDELTTSRPSLVFSQTSVWGPSWTLAIDGIDFWEEIVWLSLW